ncbi:MAG TPA: serine/threonine-protein kinase [Gemmatimonadaceae bacterium]|nr:serine/threonine-protein kinase [Gemmatimonadaceae bacterium]
MRCHRCASVAPEAAKFCLECGAALADPLAQTSIMEEDESLVLLRSLQRSLAGEFDVESEVGRGAMAIVYRATEVELGRRVALKVLPPSAPVGKAVAERFKREARLAASLDHPNIIPVYRVGQVGATHFIAMRFVDGRGLDEIIGAQGPLPVSVVIHVLRAATSALAYAHGNGIIHRDVKSGNIMVDREGRVMVADFGIARAAEDASLTATGSVVGTPYYMSPEQCAARRLGPQSDQYSLGVVAFQMLTGSVPFNAETLPGIMHHHFYTAVPDLRVARPDVPPELYEVVKRTLAKKPELRYATTDAMLDAIEAIPFDSESKLLGEDALRALARGAGLELIQTRPLPPLADPSRKTPTGTVPAMARTDGVGVARRRRVALGGVAAGALLAGVVAWLSTSPLGASGTAATTDTLASRRVAAPANGVARAPRESVTRPAAGGDSARIAAALAPVVRDTGMLRLRAYPVDAEIVVDGRLVAQGVALDVGLPVGTRKLRVRAPGYADYDTTFVVARGKITQLRRIELSALDQAQ